MKKIVLIITALLMGIVANGQIVLKNDRGTISKVEFHLGDYVFEGGYVNEFTFDTKKGYVKQAVVFEKDEFTFYAKGGTYDEEVEEASRLVAFVRENKEKIEEKYNVYIGYITNYTIAYNRNTKKKEFVYIPQVTMMLYDADYYREKTEKERIKEEQEKKEQENRINSLNSLDL